MLGRDRLRPVAPTHFHGKVPNLFEKTLLSQWAVFDFIADFRGTVYFSLRKELPCHETFFDLIVKNTTFPLESIRLHGPKNNMFNHKLRFHSQAQTETENCDKGYHSCIAKL